jgi:hypothetical protein
MSKARRAHLKQLLEVVEPRVTVRIRLKDMSPKGSPAPVETRKEPTITPVGDVTKTLAARKLNQAYATVPAPQVRSARCPKCRAWIEVTATEGSAVCSACGAGDV